MRYQKVLGPEGRRSYSSPVHPVTGQGPDHSSQNFLFRYSVIEASPVKYGLTSTHGSIEYTGINTSSRGSGLPGEADLTMENPDIYLEYTENLSESSDILYSTRE